jgi:hypothetical protein
MIITEQTLRGTFACWKGEQWLMRHFPQGFDTENPRHLEKMKKLILASLGKRQDTIREFMYGIRHQTMAPGYFFWGLGNWEIARNLDEATREKRGRALAVLRDARDDAPARIVLDEVFTILGGGTSEDN